MTYNKLKPDNNLEDEITNLKEIINNNLKINIGLFFIYIIAAIVMFFMYNLDSEFDNFYNGNYSNPIYFIFLFLIIGITLGPARIYKWHKKQINICILDDKFDDWPAQLIISKYSNTNIIFNKIKLYGKESIHNSEIKLIKNSNIIYIVNDEIISKHLSRIVNHINQQIPKPILWQQLPLGFSYDKVKIKRNKLYLKRLDLWTSLLAVTILIIIIVQLFSPWVNDEIEHHNAGIALLFVASFFCGIIILLLQPKTIIRLTAHTEHNNFKRINQPASFKVV
jgi:hypothetical protein